MTPIVFCGSGTDAVTVSALADDTLVPDCGDVISKTPPDVLGMPPGTVPVVPGGVVVDVPSPFAAAQSCIG